MLAFSILDVFGKHSNVVSIAAKTKLVFLSKIAMLTISEHKGLREGVGIHQYELTYPQISEQGKVDTYSILQSAMIFS